jgi:hypothetical protein
MMSCDSDRIILGPMCTEKKMLFSEEYFLHGPVPVTSPGFENTAVRHGAQAS